MQDSGNLVPLQGADNPNIELGVAIKHDFNPLLQAIRENLNIRLEIRGIALEHDTNRGLKQVAGVRNVLCSHSYLFSAPMGRLVYAPIIALWSSLATS